MSGLFGTDGIRGIANEPPLDAATVVAMGQALACYQGLRGGKKQILVARDTRVSGPMLEAALVAGICSSGGEPILAGILPTPAVARLAAQHLECEGVVISASHNPWRYNGIKVFGADGFKWSQQQERDFESLLHQVLAGALGQVTGTVPGVVGVPQSFHGAGEWYVQSLVETLKGNGSLSGLRLVVDCANGAAAFVAPQLFERCGATVTMVAAAPDGYNINEQCGALFPQHLRGAVLAHKADAGIAFDGDADRVLLVDETGGVLDGDHILWILARHLDQCRALEPRLVVGTVMSNFGLERALAGLGIQLVRVKVGDRYVVERLREVHARLGGEPSGHIVWLDHATTGDGLLTALAVLQIAVARQCPLSHLQEGLELVPQIRRDVEARMPERVLAAEEVQRVIASAREALQGKGRVVVRASGTEPVLRVLLEGEDGSSLDLWADRIASVIRLTSRTLD